MRPRPEPGTATQKEVSIPVCKLCGYVVDETGGCSHDCSEDYEDRTTDNTLRAVYYRSETFLRDEPYGTANDTHAEAETGAGGNG
jgi:hypothetical protein